MTDIVERLRWIVAAGELQIRDELMAVEEAADEIERLRMWIESEGERTDTCTFNVLGRVCSDCQCHRKKSEPQ